jgi:hypothetical protein
MIRGIEEDKDRTQEILGSESTSFPIKYLDLHLALRPLTRAEWQPLLDAVVHVVPSWPRGLTARAGCLVLINTIMMTRPIHHILVMIHLPGWLRR